MEAHVHCFRSFGLYFAIDYPICHWIISLERCGWLFMLIWFSYTLLLVPWCIMPLSPPLLRMSWHVLLYVQCLRLLHYSVVYYYYLIGRSVRLLGFWLALHRDSDGAANIMSLALYVSTASSCDARYFSNCFVCFIVSSVGFDDCDAIALMGHNNVLSTALPRNKNFHTLVCISFLLYLVVTPMTP